MTSAQHDWQFVRTGGFDQVELGRATDLERLGELDQKLWVALACPTKGLEIDGRTLAVIDANADDRIRAPEVIAAVEWMCKVLRDPALIYERSDSLPLTALDLTDPEAAAVHESAARIIEDVGNQAHGAITIEDIVDTQAVFAARRFNGDGVVPPAAARDDDLGLAISEMVEAVGGAVDSNGELGVTVGTVDAFFTAAQAFAHWWEQARADAEAVLPLGDDTPGALAAIDAVAAKVEDYFARCKAVAFDPRALEHLSGLADGWAEIAKATIAPNDEAIAAFPLAAIVPGAPLPLGEGLNPAWAAQMDAVRTLALEPLLGPHTAITHSQWRALVERFEAHRTSVADKAGAEVEPIGIERVTALLEGDYRARIEALIAADEELRPEADALANVDRTVRLYRDLDVVLNNFVSFRDFYSKRALATFQVGRLFLDGRSCDLVIAVEDVGSHSALAARSYINLAYCKCAQKSTGQTRTIAAAFTDGDSDFLTVGRNGVFYDRDGADWDATIVKIAANPISIRQAFWSPYKRAARFIEGQVEKLAAARHKSVDTQLASRVAAAQTTAAPPAAGTAAAPPAPAFDIGKFAGIFAAVGLALGALAAAGSVVIAGFLTLSWWQMPLALLSVVLLISGPSVVIAWVKLRQRNLAPLLDASGWAINARARLSVPFGKTLTHVARLPEGSRKLANDPYESRRSLVPALVVVLLVLIGALWYFGVLSAWAAAVFG